MTATSSQRHDLATVGFYAIRWTCDSLFLLSPFVVLGIVHGWHSYQSQPFPVRAAYYDLPGFFALCYALWASSWWITRDLSRRGFVLWSNARSRRWPQITLMQLFGVLTLAAVLLAFVRLNLMSPAKTFITAIVILTFTLGAVSFHAAVSVMMRGRINRYPYIALIGVAAIFTLMIISLADSLDAAMPREEIGYRPKLVRRTWQFFDDSRMGWFLFALYWGLLWSALLGQCAMRGWKRVFKYIVILALLYYAFHLPLLSWGSQVVRFRYFTQSGMVWPTYDRASLLCEVLFNMNCAFLLGWPLALWTWRTFAALLIANAATPIAGATKQPLAA